MQAEGVGEGVGAERTPPFLVPRARPQRHSRPRGRGGCPEGQRRTPDAGSAGLRPSGDSRAGAGDRDLSGPPSSPPLPCRPRLWTSHPGPAGDRRGDGKETREVRRAGPRPYLGGAEPRARCVPRAAFRSAPGGRRGRATYKRKGLIIVLYSGDTTVCPFPASAARAPSPLPRTSSPEATRICPGAHGLPRPPECPSSGSRFPSIETQKPAGNPRPVPGHSGVRAAARHLPGFISAPAGHGPRGATGTASCRASRVLAQPLGLGSGLGTGRAISSQEPRDLGPCTAGAPGRPRVHGSSSRTCLPPSPRVNLS